ncbi:hypothetical protein [Alphaproteobacteria bacterium endosymbiont of Tiliacea citrago]|uniref:hypothetical protein n=1 Tax=Alphaproteobacteria bacterium endosymbiont of Tiliacea citrago TaxID=3077944 RepID=UPI00313B391F
MIIKKAILTLLFMQKTIAMDQEKIVLLQKKYFPQYAWNMVKAGWIEAMNAHYADEFYGFYENIEAATRSGFDIEEKEELFDELKEFCNDNKRSYEKLPDQEITNILNFFINDIHNM